MSHLILYEYDDGNNDHNNNNDHDEKEKHYDDDGNREFWIGNNFWGFGIGD